MSHNRRGGDRVAGMGNKTSPCKTSVLNLGKTPRVPGSHDVDEKKDANKQLPAKRNERESLPTNRRIMRLLSMAVIPEKRSAFRQRFRQASKDEKKHVKSEQSNLCHVPMSWIAKAFQCEPFQLRRAGDMFPEARIESEFLNEFYVMDVILNRAPSSAAVTGAPSDHGKQPVVDCDVVRPFRLYRPDDALPEKDYCYRAAILFLPQCGVFYCHRERRRGDVGVPGSFIAHDMSWLRLQRDLTCGGREVSYKFGSDSFVKRFYTEHTGHPVYRDEHDLSSGWHFLDENHRVSAWRISTGRTHHSQQNRVIYRAVQCHDVDGPKLAPDLLQGYDFGTCPRDYLAAEYQQRLASSSSARKDGRHYVAGYLHYQLPDSCWIIDPMDNHFVDVMVDVDTVGNGMRNRQSVVMIRNVTKIDTDDDHVGLLERVTSHNAELWKVEGKGHARNKCEDLGTMHAIGTRIPLGGVGTPAPYSANGKVPGDALRDLVADLASLGSRCFPTVYSVVRDVEGDSGMLPVVPMGGEALTDTEDADEAMDGHDVELDDDESIVHEKARAKVERCRRVGYTIDMSINLGNASHFDVHDASPGYSVWTEEVPGRGANWFFVLPNVHGTKPDGRSTFRGMAVRLGHGVAISWDGRVIRHCTSVSHPDGMENGRVGGAVDSHFHNHLYGTFTAAKERIVQAGRVLSAAKYCVPTSSEKDDSDVLPQIKKKKKKKKNRRKRSGRGRQVDEVDAAEPNVDVSTSGDDVESSVVLCHHRVMSSIDVQLTTDWRSRADGCARPDNYERKRRAVHPDCPVIRQVLAGDLDVGGGYKIPKKRRGYSGTSNY
jgi:hypothetical protein